MSEKHGPQATPTGLYQPSRDNANTGVSCSYNSRVKNDRAAMLDQLAATLNSTGPVAIEMWLYNTTSVPKSPRIKNGCSE